MENLKLYEEMKADKVKELEKLFANAELEKRALDEEELKKFDTLQKAIENITATINAIKAKQGAVPKNKETGEPEKKAAAENENEDEEERDIKAFANHIRNTVSGLHTRDEIGLTKAEEGKSVIPTSVANKIYRRVEEICPIYKLATKYKVTGAITLPIEKLEDGNINVAFVDEFEEATASKANLGSVTLNGKVYTALVKVSKSLLNSTDLNLTNWVTERIAISVSQFIENCLLNGNSTVKGVVGSIAEDFKVKITDLNADALIDIQDAIPDAHQNGAVWFMSRETRNKIRKLKNAEGDYLLVQDFKTDGGYTLLGREVYTTNSAADNIFYGNFAGLAVKENEQTSIQILLEKYSTQHAIGVLAHGEIDAVIAQTDAIVFAEVAGTKKKTK